MSNVFRAVLLGLALLLAGLAFCWFFWPTESAAEEAHAEAAPRLEVVAERYWDFEERAEAIRAEERAEGPRALAESVTAQDELYAAALRLQPVLARRPRHARRTVSILFTASVEHDVNPFLTLAFASRESGLRASARGKLGEQGLLQLHGYARRKCAGTRDLSQPRVNAEAFGCYWNLLRDKCREELSAEPDNWVLVGAYGTGRCLEPADARRLACGKRKRAELVRAVGPERAATIWPL